MILRPGDGVTWVNGRTIEEYFPRLTHRAAALAPRLPEGAVILAAAGAMVLLLPPRGFF